MQAAAEKLTAALVASGIPSLLVARDGCVVWGNAAACAMFGRDADSIVGLTWLDVTHAEDFDAYRGEVEELLSGQRELLRGRRRFARSDGAAIWGDITVSCLHAADGTVEGFLAQVVDVTAETLADQALRESRALLSGAFAGQGDALAIMEAVRDEQGSIVDLRFVEANEPMLAHVDKSREDVVGQLLTEVQPETDGRRIAAYGQVVETGIPVIWKDVEFESYAGLRQRIVDFQCYKVDDGVCMVLHDVTSRTIGTREVEAARAHLQAVIDSDMDPRLLMHAERAMDGGISALHIVSANPAAVRYFGLSAEAIEGVALNAISPASTYPELLQMYTAVIESGEPLILDRVHFPSVVSGADRFFDMRAVRVGDGLSLTWRDVTDSVTAAEQLADSEERYRLLAENTSDVVLLIALDGTIEWASPSASTTLLVEPDDLVGRSNLTLIHPEDLPWFIAEARRLAASGEPARLTMRTHRGDGSYHWMESAGTPIPATERQPAKRLVRLRDVDEQVRTRQQLEASEEQFRLLAENSTDVVFIATHGSLQWVSPSVQPALGWRPEDLAGHPFEEFVHGDDVPRIEASRAVVMQGHANVERVRVRDRGGDFHWVEIHAGPYRNDEGHHIGVVVSFRVIDAEVETERQREHLARFDSLTGLMNRSEVMQALTRLAAQVPRTGSRTALMFCDVDRFKSVNDAFGHLIGDSVLRVVGEHIQACIRSDDLAARIGGDEFLVVLTGVHAIDEAVAVAEKIRTSVASAAINDADVAVTLSIGVAVAEHDDTVDQVIERADSAMYEAKRSGRDQVVAVTPR